MVGLRERLVTPEHDVKTNAQIDWTATDKGLETARAKSFKFIEEVENFYA
jgi:hypothetical protein